MEFQVNEQRSDENPASMIIAKDSSVRLLTDPFFKRFIANKEVSDAKKKQLVDKMVTLAVEGGGIASPLKQDHAWMYGHDFEDLGGHQWNVMYWGVSMPCHKVQVSKNPSLKQIRPCHFKGILKQSKKKRVKAQQILKP